MANAQGKRPPEETARFDLLISSFGVGESRFIARESKTSWRVLKDLNPNMVILVYAMGPGEYKIVGGELGEGWDWLKRNHGEGSEDRWTVRGIRYGGYLQQKTYLVSFDSSSQLPD